MTGIAPLSALLGQIVLSGRTWCYCDLGAGGGYSLPPADALWFHAVLHGQVRVTSAAGGTVELRAGDMVAVLSGEAHALRLGPDAPAVSLDFLRQPQEPDAPPAFAVGRPGAVGARVLSGRLAVQWPAGASRSALPGLVRLDGSAQGLLRAEALALAGIGPGSAALLTRLAETILLAHLRADPACRRYFSPSQQDPIDQSLRLIAANPSASWTVERLARSVGMGRSSFAAHFTARVGRAPMEVVAEARMEQAAELLRKGSLKVAEISELAGYGSEAAFSRRFARHFGMAPGQLREAARAEAPPADAPAWQPLLAGRREGDVATRLRRRAARPGGALGAGLVGRLNLKG